MKSSQGVIKEFSVDDKGTVMVGALGLPPITGSNPSARACLTALKISKGIHVSYPPHSINLKVAFVGQKICCRLPNSQGSQKSTLFFWMDNDCGGMGRSRLLRGVRARCPPPHHFLARVTSEVDTVHVTHEEA